MILGANEDYGRDHEDESMTFLKQVKSTLLYTRNTSITEPHGAQGNLFSKVLDLGGRVGEEPVNEVGLLGVGRP